MREKLLTIGERVTVDTGVGLFNGMRGAISRIHDDYVTIQSDADCPAGMGMEWDMYRWAVVRDREATPCN